jgi:WXG100 family type VII secretion target
MANDSGAKVDTGIMRAGAGVIREHAESVTTQKGQVRSTIESLIGTWKGAAAQAFDGGMQEFYTECDKITNLLQKLSTDVTGAANDYDHHDENVTAQARRVASQMTPTGGLPGL